MAIEQYGIYSQTLSEIPMSEALTLVSGTEPVVTEGELGRVFTYKIDGLTIVCSELKKTEIINHVNGLVGYIHKICSKGNTPEEYWKSLQDRILRTSLILGVEADFIDQNEDKVRSFMGALCYGLKPIVFFQNCLYDEEAKLLLAPDGSYKENT